MFNPGPIEHPHIPIQVAAVNKYNARLAGELCDGVFPHPICTPKYMKEVLLPAIESGAQKEGRHLSDIDIVGAPIIVTGRNKSEMEEEKKVLRQRVAFYLSTRTYHSVLEVHGWRELGLKLHPMSLEGKWKEMADLVPDEVAEEFAVIGSYDEIGAKLKERWGGIFSTLYLPTDFPHHTPQEQRLVRQVIEVLKQP
jgi:probable F420-dependent oxidoreductase